MLKDEYKEIPTTKRKTSFQWKMYAKGITQKVAKCEILMQNITLKASKRSKKIRKVSYSTWMRIILG
jgi:hypothetical protein